MGPPIGAKPPFERSGMIDTTAQNLEHVAVHVASGASCIRRRRRLGLALKKQERLRERADAGPVYYAGFGATFGNVSCLVPVGRVLAPMLRPVRRRPAAQAQHERT